MGSTFSQFDAFRKAKGMRAATSLGGGARRAMYADPSRVRVFEGRDINGSRRSPDSPANDQSAAQGSSTEGRDPGRSV